MAGPPGVASLATATTTTPPSTGAAGRHRWVTERPFGQGSVRRLRGMRFSACVPGRRGLLRVSASSGERRPFSRPEHAHNGAPALPQSLFMPITGELPEEGQFLTEAEATCDEMEKFCGDPYYVYESDCRPCFGTGSVRSAVGGRRGARQVLVECPHCNGLGLVRRVTSRFFPMDSEEEHVQTVARKEEYRTHLHGRSAAPQPKKISKPKDNPTLIRKPPSYYKSRRKNKSGDGAIVRYNGSNVNNANGSGVMEGGREVGEQAGVASS